MIFSDIVQRFDTSLNALYQERQLRRSRGLPIVDLISANVTQAGFIFPEALLRRCLQQGLRQSRIYHPHPLGQPVARAAVSNFYAKERLKVSEDHILITPGTSVSYWYLFKLLANAGDEILCPRPSYPLLDAIAELCGIRLIPYRLLEKRRWEIDLEHLQSRITSKTRAIVLISPHNPTGAVATERELAGLSMIAAKHHLPIISDEVFSAFLFEQEHLPRPDTRAPLVFTLNGISKMLALPGLKLGWIAVSGDPSLVKKSMRALDLMSDTFLPVNEAIQFTFPPLLLKGKGFMSRFQHEVLTRAQLMMHQLREVQAFSWAKPEGGFYLTLRLKEKALNEEKLALQLLQQEGLLLHPGYFYDMPGAHLILSFVSPTNTLLSAVKKIKHILTQKLLSR